MVISGADTFGVVGGPDTLLVARSKDQPIKAVAVIHKDSNFVGLVTLQTSGITRVEQLDNKKVGFFYGHISTDVLRNLFHKTGTSVQEVDVGFDYSKLIANQIDAQWAFSTTAGINLPTKGIEVNFISPKNYDITTHGHTLIVSENTVQSRPGIVARFLKATIKGIQETVENPEQSPASLLKQDSRLDPSAELQRLKLDNQATSNSERYPAGYMDYQMFQETYDRLVEEKIITNQFDVHDAYDIQFLEKIHKRKFND